MSVDLSILGNLVTELREKKQSVEAAIEETEARLKMLRVIKQSLGVQTEPKPRKSRQKEPANA